MIDTIIDLQTRARLLHAQARKLEAAVNALQETCDHDGTTEYEGRYHQKDYYSCTQCGKEWHE